MSVDQLPPGKARPAKSAAQFVRYGEYIDQQIESTRWNVKVVDVLTALLTIVVGMLAFLLVAAVVEHWLLPGGYNVALRLVLFALLFTCLTFYTTRKLWPLVRGSINPAYAAQAIEQDNPTLKNSLLNLLLFRQYRDDVTDAVYETLEEQAATRLHRVPVDAAVDRTSLLRLGYALIAVLAIVALYKILSPKDPFTSAERVLMPWARIAAPSRVSIENIEPGHVTLARGETLSVAADVRGIGADDPVVVKFTTADGQAVDRPAAMKPDAANLRFTGKIPPDGDLSLGVAQDLRYYIEAGDARSLEYKVTVVSAPTITVERVEYDYPEYTGFADRSIERLGDIRAIEGTRVTIHARANQSIDEASIDFQADGRRDLSLTAEGEQARATFTLELRDDRETPKFTSYVLRFTGSDGRPNRNPVKHPIDVVPDLRPEAAILAPQEKARDVRLDETVDIEIEARDPDFALSDVRLTGESAGRTVFNAQLLAKSHNGRFVGRLAFTPAEHELHAGDVVRYWVSVRDNRTPQANEATTDSQTFRIVGPDARQPVQPPRDRMAQREQPPQRDPQQPQNEQQEQQSQEQDQQASTDESSTDESITGESSQNNSSEGQAGQSSGESGDSSASEGNTGDSGEQGSADQSNADGQGENSQNQSGEQQSGGESSGAGESSASKQVGQAGQGEQQPGGKQESGGNQAGDPQQGSPDGAQGGSQSPQENGQGSQDDSQRGGEGAAPRSAREKNDSSPVSSDGDNDGEAFERIQEFLKEQGQLPKESQQQLGESEQSNRENGSPEQVQKQESGESSDRESSEGEAQSRQRDSAPQQPGTENTADNERGAEESSSETGQPSGEDSQNDNANRDSGGEQPGAESHAGSDSQAGAEAQPGADDEKTGEPAGQHQQQQQPGGGQKSQSEGESGAGNQAEQGKAPPESPGNDSTEKWQQDSSGENQGEQQQRPDAGRGERQSDSHGEQGGEQTGAAEENNAKKSERDGTGSSGQNQSADEGMGESSEQGAGRNSTSGGQDAQANQQTGQSNESMQGEGSQQREGQGDSPGGAQGGQEAQQREQQEQSQGGEEGEQRQGSSAQSGQEQGQQGESGQQQSPESGGEQGASDRKDGSDDAAARESQNEKSNEQQGSPRSGNNASDGAGRVPQGVMQPGGATGEAPGADAANLEYARRQTDLVLETLAEQMKRQKVDKRLLDKLGWTEADMKRFVERWQQLKAAAEANHPDANEAQRELDDALRSLGLRRGELRQSTVTDDQNRNLRQGYRGAVPLEYQERLRAYNQGVSRARQSDE